MGRQMGKGLMQKTETETETKAQDQWPRTSEHPLLSTPLQGMLLPLDPRPVLLLREVGLQDQGTYSCVATHPSLGSQESPGVTISISGEISLLARALGRA